RPAARAAQSLRRDARPPRADVRLIVRGRGERSPLHPDTPHRVRDIGGDLSTRGEEPIPRGVLGSGVMALIVQKYGGSSVGDAEKIHNVARRVAASAPGHALVV